MSALGEARKGMRPGGTWPAVAVIQDHFSAQDGGAELRTLFDYVIGSGVRTSHFRVGYKASIGFMVGKDISANARREVNGEVTCQQERVRRSAYGAPLTQLVS